MEKKWRVGVIRVVTQHDPVLMKLHGELIERYFPMLETESRCIPDQPMGIHDPESKAVAIPKILETAKLFSGIDVDRKSTRLNSSHSAKSRMPSSA